MSNPVAQYWLMKTEPSVFSLEDLATAPAQTTHWEGVRNYQARNFMRDRMKAGDRAFLYHSVREPVGIVATMQVVREAYPDHFQWEPQSKYYDPKATPDKPIWFMVDVQLQERFPRAITLKELRDHPQLAEMALLQRGSRLSIQPVTPAEWQFIYSLVN